MILERTMILWFVLLGSVLSMPTDEFREFTNNGVGDFVKISDKSNIVPSKFHSFDNNAQYYKSEDKEWAELLDLNPGNEFFEQLNKQFQKGNIAKDLTFCIYDDNMREAATALFRIFQSVDSVTFPRVKEWARKKMNEDMYMYALRLEALYTCRTNATSLLPPFIWNPNYFVNSESLTKAALVANDVINYGANDDRVSKLDQVVYLSPLAKDFAVVNSNYSGWNLPNNGKEDNLNYFREDVSMNSYYFGVHLMHPFWMSNEELEYNNPRFAEHYYYAHQQLMARYNLEKLHSKTKNPKLTSDYWNYIPYLRYKNGLPFPTRTCIRGDWDSEHAFIKSIDIAIRECISRGLLIMQNGTTLTMTDDSHINILAKLIRANLDGVKFGKIVRSLMGYGANVYPIDEYNPAPSILHHPETSLRDPAYWFMLQQMLSYFTDYKNTMEPFDLSQYETDEFEIVDYDFSRLLTYFNCYKFSVNFAMTNSLRKLNNWLTYVAVRQRRLKHADFYLNFTVNSKVEKKVIVRLYLGPECSSDDCWEKYNDFFELDTFHFTLKQGQNLIPWSPNNSTKFSFDEDFNTFVPKTGSTRYNMFKFPENLLIPRGLEEGLKLTVFIMITPADAHVVSYPPILYREVSKELDSKPLGFPFHRKAKGFTDSAQNYQFFNVTVYHKHQPIGHKGFYSPHLY